MFCDSFLLVTQNPAQRPNFPEIIKRLQQIEHKYCHPHH
jgi:hypothetical protein